MRVEVKDLDKLRDYLSSETSPPDSMGLSDLDGFLTGILCSPDLIMPSTWMPLVWGGPDPDVKNIDKHMWAMQEIMKRYNEIAAALNAEPPYLEPVFWQAPEGHVIAMDWCEGFMDAFSLQRDAWHELLRTEEGRNLLFPIIAHCFDEKGQSLVGAKEEDMDALLDTAVKQIPEAVPKIFAFWQSKRVVQN